MFKLLQLPDGKFEDCFELQHLTANKEWEELLSFKDVKDGMEIRVTTKAFTNVVDLPAAAEGALVCLLCLILRSARVLWSSCYSGQRFGEQEVS